MILKYLFPNRNYSFSYLDKVTYHQKGKWTWDSAMLIFLSSLGLEVIYIADFDFSKFAKFGEDYLKRIWDKETFEIQKKYSNLSQERLLARQLIDNKKIKVVFSLPKTFIDQQAGCDLKCLTERFEKAFEVWKEDKPALLIPTGDGENGNVMMNEFFPQTFLPFFKRGYPKVSSYLISEFLEKFYKKIDQKIEISSVGGSWIDHHEQWLVGSKRLEIIKEIEKISSIYHSLKNKSEELKKLLLIAETSCYVYWNIDYWFNQGKKAIQKFLSLIKKLNI